MHATNEIAIDAALGAILHEHNPGPEQRLEQIEWRRARLRVDDRIDSVQVTRARKHKERRFRGAPRSNRSMES
jgi:hypothetical protein